ncbi:rod-determining factor RdfA [Halorubrum vacuolatum]|uniref:Uncharacterized protein n=1 Tax=Halorubrum vacuolatum TaxID=63740 RepID=A0A238Y2W5_HALVU|nr:rod-determining factor RdfA [Halorubrum vacuolatum]SNR65467.1 hypothetical protein SAMN06264855_1293 [Halorubrum vacuolatum]
MPCKIETIAEKYDLTALDDELKTAKARGDSLRNLETLVNQEIVKQAFRSAGSPLVPGEVENLTRLLRERDGSEATEIQVRNKCTREGVDPDELYRDFVSYQTVRTHLRDCLDIDTSRGTTLSVGSERKNLYGIVGRTESIVQDSVERLDKAGEIDFGPVSVTANVRVTCEECARSYTLEELSTGLTCDCTSE